MNKRSHVVTAAGLALTLCLWLGCRSPLAVAAAALVGATVPDLDLRRGHRVYMHNLFTYALSAMAVYVAVLALLGPHVATGVVLGYSAGYLSHILLDALTVRGVAVLYPLTRRRLRLARLRSSSRVANLLPPLVSMLLLLASILLLFPSILAG